MRHVKRKIRFDWRTFFFVWDQAWLCRWVIRIEARFKAKNFSSWKKYRRMKVWEIISSFSKGFSWMDKVSTNGVSDD